MADPTQRHLTEGLSRRGFLAGTAAALAGSTLSQVAKGAGNAHALAIAPERPRARVVQLQERRLIDGPRVHQPLLQESVQRLLTAQTKTASPAAAWRKLLSPDDVVGVKFNRSGQAFLGTSTAMAEVLVESLASSGWPREQIVLIEAPDGVIDRTRTLAPAPGFALDPTDFGSGSDYFAAVLDQITALIDVPYLKSHNIAGMTCALKNLSHGLIKHPARYHDNGCSPYIPDIVNADAIRRKLKLCIVDAMRIVFTDGPTPTAANIADTGLLLAATDPVAVDTVALAQLNAIRRRFDLAPIAARAADLPYLATAHRRGLGIAAWHGIDLEKLAAEDG